MLTTTIESERAICGPCRLGDHAECEPVPVEENGLGGASEGTAYVQCRCLCDPMAGLRSTADEYPAATDHPGADR